MTMRWILALVLASVAVGGFWWWWLRVEARVFPHDPPAPTWRDPRQLGAPRPAPPPNLGPRSNLPTLPPGDEGHLQFARSLVGVAEWYAQECEDRARRRT